LAERAARRRALRRQLRAARRALSNTEQSAHARAVAQRLLTTRLPMFARRFALYAPNDGELDPSPLIDALIARHRLVTLPVVLPKRLLEFYRYTPTTRLVRNRYGIAEPDSTTGQYVNPRTLDVVLLPLVGFDDAGHRLGMGGGYYDATFAHAHCEPLLIGLAHELQRVDGLPVAPWDVPLDAVVTESRLLICTRRGRRILNVTTASG
jgi:5-formyltetrahydrofolate cyclo-ligase